MFAAVGCGGAQGESQTDDSKAGDETEAVGTAREAVTAAQTCVSIRRAYGDTVIDSVLQSNSPTVNSGNKLTTLTGTVLPGQRQAVIQFDLTKLAKRSWDTSPGPFTAIPKRALIKSAKLTFQQTNNGLATLRAHQITAPWDEMTVNWNTLNPPGSPANWDAAVVSQTTNAQAAMAFDVKDIVQKWVAYGVSTATAAVQNYGLLLEQSPANYTLYTSIRASDSATTGGDPNIIPRLDVCFVDQAPPAGQIVNGGTVSTSPGYKAVYTIGQPTSNQGRSDSPGFRLQGGLIGATGTLP
jgi:hypothetical protein